jgi:hypothetical protein
MQLKSIAKLIALTVVLTASVFGQQITNTNCNASGNQINCNSTTTDNSVQQQQAYEAGQAAGSAIGNGVAIAIVKHRIKKYCESNPGSDWNIAGASGHCMNDNDKVLAAANQFVSRHKDYMRSPENTKLMIAYFETNNLDPREEKYYDRAYKELKSIGKLALYSK